MRSHLAAHYTLAHRAIATVSHWFDGYTYTVRHGLLAGMRRKGGLGFLPFGPAPTPEVLYFLHRDFAGEVVYDIGGFEGLLTVFFATRADRVIVYEPNPSSRSRLEENLRLNNVQNVTVRPVGVGAVASRATLVFDPLMPGAASVDATIGGQIRDTARQSLEAEIQIVTLDEDIFDRKLPAPDFVKIDVEGLELSVLRGMHDVLRVARPTLYIEMHGATMEEKRANADAVVALLHQSRYALQHVETGSAVTLHDSATAAQGHLVAEPI